MDHALIKKQWCHLLGAPLLPEGHYAVFKAITQYSQVNRDDVYKLLGITANSSQKRHRKYSKPTPPIPTQLSLKGDEKRFEYLGFQFDGVLARFRDKTVSAFYRKLKWTLYSEARDVVRRFPGKPLAFLDGKFDESELLQRFGRRKGFANCLDVHQWTFWTYATRSTEIMKPFGSHLYRQISNYKKFVRQHRVAALAKALEQAPNGAGLPINMA